MANFNAGQNISEAQLSELVDALGRLNQNGFGYLQSAIRNHVFTPNQTERIKIQKDLEQLTYGLSIVYLFAVFEDYINWNYVKNKHTDILQYSAYRHIRHSCAHKYNGKRAQEHRQEFEDFYNQNGFCGCVKWDQASDTLVLCNGIVGKLRTFLINSIGMIANAQTHQ